MWQVADFSLEMWQNLCYIKDQNRNLHIWVADYEKKKQKK